MVWLYFIFQNEAHSYFICKIYMRKWWNSIAASHLNRTEVWGRKGAREKCWGTPMNRAHNYEMFMFCLIPFFFWSFRFVSIFFVYLISTVDCLSKHIANIMCDPCAHQKNLLLFITHNFILFDIFIFIFKHFYVQ